MPGKAFFFFLPFLHIGVCIVDTLYQSVLLYHGSSLTQGTLQHPRVCTGVCQGLWQEREQGKEWTGMLLHIQDEDGECDTEDAKSQASR